MRSRGVAIVIVWCVGCSGAQKETSVAAAPSVNACGSGAERVRALLERLPVRFEANTVSVDLPESTLGMAPTGGSVLALGRTGLTLDGKAVLNSADLRSLDASKGPLYLAAPAATTVRDLREIIAQIPNELPLRLLVHTRLQKGAPGIDPATPAWAREQAVNLLEARDAESRTKLATEGYRQATGECERVATLVSSSAALEPTARWQKLRAELPTAVDACDCHAVDVGALEALVAADHRSGLATLGSLPVSFMRDQRCGASMPLRSLAKLVGQMEQFDIEFSGKADGDELHFDDVLTNERFLVEFCDALAGETLAALQRARRTLYWPVQKGAEVECQPWRFDPVTPGAPTGTWTRLGSPGGTATSEVLEYSEAAEELHLSVPARDGASAEAPRCKAVYRLVGVDQDSIHLVKGHWFFTAEGCRRAGAAGVPSGTCVDAWVAGSPPAETTPGRAPR